MYSSRKLCSLRFHRLACMLCFISVAAIGLASAALEKGSNKISTIFYNDISNYKLTNYIKSNLCIVAFYHPKIQHYYKEYLKNEFQSKLAAHYNENLPERKIIVATVNIGTELRKKMATTYSINRPFVVKVFLPGYNSFGIELMSADNGKLFSTKYIIEQVDYIYNERLNVTLPLLQPVVDAFMDSVDTNKQNAINAMENMDTKSPLASVLPTLPLNLYKKTMQGILKTGTGQIATDYLNYHRQLRMEFAGDEDIETILLTYERLQILEQFLIHLFGETHNALHNIYKRLLLPSAGKHSNPVYHLYFNIYKLPNVYNDINSIFVDEIIYNVTNLYKGCQAKQIAMKEKIYDQHNINYSENANVIYMPKGKIKTRIKSTTKLVDNGEDHNDKGNTNKYKLFNEFGDIYNKCLCIKDLLEDAYYIRDHGNAGDNDMLTMEMDVGGSTASAKHTIPSM